MTQIGLGFGQLIQQGIGRGWDNYRADQQMAMQRQAMEEQRPMQALRMQALQQELEQRRLEAQRLLEQEDADRQVFEAMGRAGQPTVLPEGADPVQDWTAGIDATAASRASPRVQDLLARHKSDRMAYANRKAELANAIALARASGLSMAMPVELWDEANLHGVQGLNLDDMPREVRERMTNRSENTKLAQVDLMTDAESDGSVDVARREWLLSKPAEVVDLIFRQQWLPEQKARREQQAAEAQQKALAQAYRVMNDPNATPEQRSQAQAMLAQMNAPMGGAGRATGNPSMANDRAVQAFKVYMESVNDNTKDDNGRLDQGESAKRRRVLAAEAYQAAINGHVTPDGWAIVNGGRKSADGTYQIVSPDGAVGWITEDALRAKMSGGGEAQGGVPNSAQPAPPSSQRPSPSFPAATYGTAANDPAPGGETPRDFGEAYSSVADGTAEGPDAMVDRFLSENQNAHNQYDLDPLIERMLDAGVSGDEIKRALTAKGFKP